MGTTVSKLKFWLEQLDFFSEKEDKGDSIYLSYNVFLGLSIILGFFGLDHLYLRSPLTFIAKFVINLMFFGVWYFYDMIQALFNSDVIKLYGLSVPIFGPQGIAAGVLSKEIPSKLHWNFFIYALCLMGGGMFGLDSFVVGDNQTGVIRLILLISVIGAPIALVWWIYHLFLFFTDTESVINSNSDFFGKEGGGAFKSWLFGMIPRFLVPLIEAIFGPITAAISTVGKSAEAVKVTVTETAGLAKAAVEEIPELAENIKGIVSAASTIGSITPLALGTTQGALQASSNMQRSQQVQQGGNLNALPYTLVGTVTAISVAGLALTYYRSKKNVQSQDDSPPEPGVLRKSYQKESTTTA